MNHQRLCKLEHQHQRIIMTWMFQLVIDNITYFIGLWLLKARSRWMFSRSYTYCGLYCTQKLDTGNLINKFSIAQWSNYSGGPRGPGPPEKKLADPAKHLFWVGSRGPVKGPLKLQDITHRRDCCIEVWSRPIQWITVSVISWRLLYRCFLQFASVFVYWNCSRKTLRSPNVTYGGPWRPQNIFLGSLSLAIFYINYAVIRLLAESHNVALTCKWSQPLNFWPKHFARVQTFFRTTATRFRTNSLQEG